MQINANSTLDYELRINNKKPFNLLLFYFQVFSAQLLNILVIVIVTYNFQYLMKTSIRKLQLGQNCEFFRSWIKMNVYLL